MEKYEMRDYLIQLLEDIKEWPEPDPRAGQGHPIAGAGGIMIAQYEADRIKHRRQVQEIIDYMKDL